MWTRGTHTKHQQSIMNLPEKHVLRGMYFWLKRNLVLNLFLHCHVLVKVQRKDSACLKQIWAHLCISLPCRCKYLNLGVGSMNLLPVGTDVSVCSYSHTCVSKNGNPLPGRPATAGNPHLLSKSQRGKDVEIPYHYLAQNDLHRQNQPYVGSAHGMVVVLLLVCFVINFNCSSAGCGEKRKK